jgi:hypothetical protein
LSGKGFDDRCDAIEELRNDIAHTNEYAKSFDSAVCVSRRIGLPMNLRNNIESLRGDQAPQSPVTALIK